MLHMVSFIKESPFSSQLFQFLKQLLPYLVVTGFMSKWPGSKTNFATYWFEGSNKSLQAWIFYVKKFQKFLNLSFSATSTNARRYLSTPKDHSLMPNFTIPNQVKSFLVRSNWTFYNASLSNFNWTWDHSLILLFGSLLLHVGRKFQQ